MPTAYLPSCVGTCSTAPELPVGAGDAAACISGNNFGKVRLTFTFYFLSFAKSLPLLRERASTAGRFS